MVNAFTAARDYIKSIAFYDELNCHKGEEGDVKNDGKAVADTALNANSLEYDENFKGTYNVSRIIFFGFYHVTGFIGIIRCFFSLGAFYVGLYTLFSAWLMSRVSTLVSHRLFAHRAFKVTPNFKKFLLALQTMTAQNAAWTWARDHRLHHKYTDTHADPHNSKRGFWFSHIGWCLMEKHPYVIKAEKEIDMSDLEEDKWVRLQYKHFLELHTLMSIVIPVAIPYFFIHRHFWDCFFIAYGLRTILIWHLIFCVNSWAHLYGNKPYHVGMNATETSIVSILSGGEGWHNFHHSFPFDYRAGETGSGNDTAWIIEQAAKLGWAYDLRKATNDMIVRRSEKYGDGTREEHLKKFGKWVKSQ